MQEPAYDSRLHGDGARRAARTAAYRIGPLQRALKSGPAQRLVWAMRGARVVREPVRFAARQLRGAGAGTYRLRDGGSLHMRHDAEDVIVMHQILGCDTYRPPPSVQAHLAGLPPVRRITDLGANIGLFCLDSLRRHPEAEITAVEADPGNSELLAENVAINGIGSQVTVVNAAAGAAEGTVRIGGDGSVHRRVLEPGQDDRGTSVEAIDALPLVASCDFAKIDIEGSEWVLLVDPRFAQIETPVITLEWHAFACPDRDPQAAAERALRQAGYSVEHDFISPTCGTLWAWK